VDSFIVETNVHFPTDINLTWDCARKSMDMIRKLKKELSKQGVVLPDWREEKDRRRKLRNQYRHTSEIHRKKGKNYKPRLKKAVLDYIVLCKRIVNKCRKTLSLEGSLLSGEKIIGIVSMLRNYVELLEKHIDLLNRRILKGEQIPHKEKMFSIFEQHTRWNNKGKVHKKVELGLPLLIATDQYQFINHHKVMETQTDADLTQSTGLLLKEKYTEGYNLSSISFDRGFYSGPAKEVLENEFDEVVMPKPGKKSLVQLQQEGQY